MYNLPQILNQKLEYFTRNWCTIYTLFWIIMDQWHLILFNEEVIKVLRQAEEEKVWWEAWWAYFSKIYDWFVWYIFLLLNVKLRVKEVSILSDEFEYLISQWYSFGLWLKKANSTYVELVKDWELSQDDVTKIFSSWKWTWHNHRYFKWYIIESLNLQDNTIKLSLEALREAVRLWLYYQTARTLMPSWEEAEKISEYLKIFWEKPNYNIIPSDDFERECLNKAWTIYLSYKAGRNGKN